MKNFKATIIEQGIHITGEAQDLNGNDYPVSLLMSTDEAQKPWDEAVEWAQERGGLPTPEQLRAIQKHRDEINAALKEAGKKPLDGWYWTSEELPSDPRDAYGVSMYDGIVAWSHKYFALSVRAVSAFQPNLEV